MALPLFAKKGFAGTSIRTISSAAECNVATIAYHFGDKEGLYLEVSQHLHLELAAVIPTIPDDLNPENVIHWWISHSWQFCKNHREHIRLLLRNVLDRGQLPPIAVKHAGPLIGQADSLVSAFRPNWPVWKRKMLVLTIQHALTRFMLEDPNQLAILAEIHPGDVDRIVVDYLTDLVERELGLTA